jgi:hypothetical protein
VLSMDSGKVAEIAGIPATTDKGQP